MSKHPEALRLAMGLEGNATTTWPRAEAAAALRRRCLSVCFGVCLWGVWSRPVLCVCVCVCVCVRVYDWHL